MINFFLPDFYSKRPRFSSGLFAVFIALRMTALAQPAAPPLSFRVERFPEADALFRQDPVWRGADGAASVDLGGGRTLWLFSDSFICTDSTGSRAHSTLIRNSLAIQRGYAIDSAKVTFYYDGTPRQPASFFREHRRFWYWTGHGIRVRDRLLVFLMKIRGVKTGLGFEAFDWQAVLIDNPDEEPGRWRPRYLKSPVTWGALAGSSAVLSDDNYLYAFGVQEPATHEVYLLRWPLEDAYRGRLTSPEWWLGDHWAARKRPEPAPPALFIGQTEFSVHYDTRLRKYIQVQSYGFGDAEIGLRTADRLEGPWSEPRMIYHPPEARLPDRLMYTVNTHPEWKTNGLVITYNINSFRWEELVANEAIYFPFFVRLVE